VPEGALDRPTKRVDHPFRNLSSEERATWP
jgi:hypothetical protein